MSVTIPTKDISVETKEVFNNSAGYKWQLEDGIEEYIKLNMGIVE